ncbi:MAG: radical SAM protein [Phycisphaerales bacterium]|nr:radical SAM protein [Phycisphaerales bacterium]
MQRAGEHPLGQTAEQFRIAFPRIVLGGGVAVLRRYAAIFRKGDLSGLEAFPVGGVNRVQTSESAEGTVVKFTQWVAGRKEGERLEAESVLIPMIGKRRVRAYTLCVSSQVGCAMGCGFCQTAQMGLVRSLEAWEIVQQWFAASELLREARRLRRADPEEALAEPRGSLADASGSDKAALLDPEAEIRNIVFMGMGEPMDNLDAVMQSIGVLTGSRGPAIAPARVTVSTVGRIDGIERFAQFVDRPGNHRIGLAVSLNAPNDEVRSRIMPINRAMPMARLREALLRWPFYAGKHLCIEYVLIPGVNDSPEQADELARYVKGRAMGVPTLDIPAAGVDERSHSQGLVRPPSLTLRAPMGGPYADAPPLVGMVNVIPYNPREGSPWPAPTEDSVDAFVARLSSHGVYTKRRRTKGRDRMAACGQLGNLAYRRKPVGVTVSR